MPTTMSSVRATNAPTACPARPLRDILDYKSVLERVFDPVVYAKRLDRLVSLLDCSGRPREFAEGDLRQQIRLAR
jgi:hypothetical protein